MVIAVTGANGFIGRSLCECLREAGLEVKPLTRDDYGELSATTNWAPLLQNVECIVHTAARAHSGYQNTAALQETYRSINTDATKALAEQAASSGVRRLIFISTAQVHGRASDQVVTETDPLAVNQSPYIRAKINAEMALLAVAANTGLQVVILRLPLVYGPNAKANFYSLAKLAISGLPLPFGKIQARRSYLYIGNLCDAVKTCIGGDYSKAGAYLVADNESADVRELASMIAAAKGKKARFFSLPPSWLRAGLMLMGKKQLAESLCNAMILDTSAFRKRFGWQPPVTLEQGIQSTIQQMKL